VARDHRGRFNLYGLADRRVEALLAGAVDILSGVAQGVYVCPQYDTKD
jgi:hypothetical protein